MSDNYIADAVKKARKNPEWFFRKILRVQIEQWQLNVIEAVQDVSRCEKKLTTKINHLGKNRISIRSGHGPGKTWMLAGLLHWWNFTHKGLAVATAPKLDVLKTRLWPRYRLIKRTAIPAYQELITVNATSVIVADDPDQGVIAETASEPDNLAGYHDHPQLFVVDEAGARTLDQMYPAIEGALSTEGSVLVEIGNPTRTEGEFFMHHNKPALKKHYFCMHIKPEDSSFVSASWVRLMRDKYGPQSPIYRVRVLGEFATISDDIIFHYDHLSEIYDTTHEPDGSIPQLKISVDVADGGADQSIITVALQYDSFTRLVKQLDFNFVPSESPILVAMEAAKVYDHYFDWVCQQYGEVDGSIIVDAIGVGAGTVGWLRINRPELFVVAHKGSEAAPNPYRNKRCARYFALAKALTNRTVYVDGDFVEDMAAWDEFTDELMAVTRDTSSGKLGDIIRKKDYKKLKGKSPDRPDSVSMIFADCDADIAEEHGSEAEILTFGTL